MNVGELIAFLLYLNLFFAPIQQLSQVFDSYQQARVAIARITELLDTPTTVPPPADPVVPGRLARRRRARRRALPVRDRGRRGAARRRPAHRDRARRSRSSARPARASRRSIKLVARFYDPTVGPRAASTASPVDDYDQVAFHQQLGVVPQEAFLFSGTIRDNIAYGREAATDAEVEAAARAVGAHDFIAALPGGYLQWVSERGRSLSSGQRQLIALARAHLVDPAILLLDEATSNLDLQTEAKVQAAMGVAAQRPHDDPHRAPAADRAPRRPHRRHRRRPRRRGRQRTTTLVARRGRYARDVGGRRRRAGRGRELKPGPIGARYGARMPEMPVDEPGRTWWRDGVLYQIYPRSYMDTNGDGVGDLRGIIERLDHLQWLGVDGIWLDPITVSPNDDWGYDVADYCDVDPALGTLADADELDRAKRPSAASASCSTSSRTTRATSTRGSSTPSSSRDVRSTATGTCGPIPKPDGSPPNNWVKASTRACPRGRSTKRAASTT